MAFTGIVLCLLAKHPGHLLILLAACHLLLIGGGIHPSLLIMQWRNLALLLAIIVILQPIIVPGSGPAVLKIGPIGITSSGVVLGVHYALRVAGAAFFALIPIPTTSAPALVRGLQKIGLPYLWGMTLELALRYMGTVGETYKIISEAQQARGIELAKGNLIARAKAIIPTLIAVIIASLRLSDSLAIGMAARGFGMKRTRTWRQDIRMSGSDWAIIGVSGVIGALAAWCIMLT
jgi:energy-coupling factor transport system permease protein